jgi:hypothetical protein
LSNYFHQKIISSGATFGCSSIILYTGVLNFRLVQEKFQYLVWYQWHFNQT